MIDAQMLTMLVCPEDQQYLEYVESAGALYNPRLGRVYEVRNGIPVMLVSDAHQADEAERAELSKLIDSGASLRTGSKGNQ